jgi:subtilisin family serine protease
MWSVLDGHPRCHRVSAWLARLIGAAALLSACNNHQPGGGGTATATTSALRASDALVGKLAPMSPDGAPLGVIVRLNGAAAFEKHAAARSRGLAAARAAAAGQRQTLRTQHAHLLDVLGKKLGPFAQRRGKGVVVGRSFDEFTDVVNGLALHGIDEATAKSLLANEPDVASIEPIREVRATLIQSVPMIEADKVWAIADANGVAIDGGGMRIGIIDTGVDYTHPDLGGCFGPGCKVVAGYDFVNHDGDPMDDMGHGTHCAATAAGNGTYAAASGPAPIKGVAPGAQIYAYKVLNSNGIGYTPDIVAAIEACADPNGDGDPSDHLDVCSMSLGGGGDPDDTESLAVDAATANGVVFAIAAGNGGPTAQTIGSPGTSRRAITVAAACKTAAIGVNPDCATPIASYSSRGPVVWNGQTLAKPDVAAPGESICAAEWGTFASGSRCLDGRHITLSGTSMATPHIAGVAALLRQAHPEWTPDQVKSMIVTSAHPLGLDPTIQGAGLVDALDALTLGGVPSSIARVGGTPLSDVDVPTARFATFSSDLTITNTTAGDLSFTGSFSGPTGLAVTLTPPSFTVAPGATATVTVSRQVDHTVVASGTEARGTITFSSAQGDVNVGLVVGVRDRVQASPATVDLGIDLASLSTWTGQVTLQLTNLLADTDQTLTASLNCCTSGGQSGGAALVATLDQSTVTIGAGGTASLSVTVTATNGSLASGRWDGLLTVSSPLGGTTIPVTFFKGYGMRIDTPTIPSLIAVSSAQSGSQTLSTATTSTTIYSTTPGPFTVEAVWPYLSTWKHSLAVLATDVPLATTTLDPSQAIYTYDVRPTDENGQPYPNGLFMTYRFTHSASGGGIIRGLPVGGTSGQIVYASALPAGVTFTASAIGGSSDAAGYLYELPGPVTASQVFTNAASDVLVKEVRILRPGAGGTTLTFAPLACLTWLPWTSSTPGGPVTGIRASCYFGSTFAWPSGVGHMRFYNSANRDLLAAPYPDAPFISYQLLDSSGASIYYGPNLYESATHPLTWLPTTPWSFTVHANEVYAHFKCDEAPGNVLAIGPGPMQDQWAWGNHSSDYGTVRGKGQFNDPFVWGGCLQDHEFTVAPVPYRLSRDGALVASGNLGSQGLFPAINNDGSYRFEMTRTIPIGGVSTTVETVSTFDVSSLMTIDENPPALQSLHLLGRGLWQEVLDTTVVNTLRFRLDPTPGNGNLNPTQAPFYLQLADSLASVTVQQSTDGTTWSPVATTSLGNGDYTTDLLEVDPTAPLAWFRIAATDLAGNSLQNTFQLPLGTAYAPAGSDVTPPTTTITSPAAGATLAGSAVPVTATATDDVGVTRVDLLLDGAVVATAMAPSSPLAFTLDTSLGSTGTHVLQTRAQDAALNLGLSAPVSVTLQNSDTTPPTVSFAAPDAGSLLHGVVSVTVNASDNARVDRVELYEGATLLATATLAPYTFDWTTTSGADGPRSLRAVAYDPGGNSSTATLDVSIDNTLPTVTWTFPTDGASVSGIVTLAVNAADNVGVARVEYWINDYGMLTSSSTAPFSVPFNLGVYQGERIALRAHVYDTAGNLGYSALINVNVVADTTPPTVAIVSPVEGAIVGANSQVWVSASDPSGITAYEVDNDGSPIAQNGATGPGPYEADFHASGLADGTHTLTARARDGAFNWGVSAPVHVILDQVPPTVSVTSPANGARVAGLVTVTAMAGDAVALASVSLDIDGLGTIQTLTTGPFVFLWDTTAWADGQHAINVHAIDKAGNEAVAAAYVTLDSTVTATVTAPAPGALVGKNVPFTATTTNDAAVASLAFYDGTSQYAVVPSPPWTTTWNPSTSGSHSLTVQVTDRKGRVTTSPAVVVTADVTAPTVSLTAPANNATVTGIVAVTATAGDNTAVARVELYDGATLLATVASSPYATAWDTSTATLGAHTLRARAYDTVGNATDSAPINVTVTTAPPPDTTPPTVAITAPGAGAVVTGTVTWSATASDNVGVTKVELRDGATVVTTLTASPYTFSWSTSSVATGAHTLTATAYDAAGNRTTSASCPITIDRTAPTVSLTAPASGATVSGTVTVSATAADNTSVARVEFYRDGSTLLAIDTTSPYSISWDTTTLAAGSHALTAKAYDAAGNVTTSASRSVTVKDITAPTVTFTSPANGAHVTVGSTITMAATATDATGVSKVEFSVGSTLTCTERLVPYTCNWKVPAGANKSYTLTAKAYDAANNTRTATVTVTSK